MNRKDKAKNVKKSVIEINSPQGYMLPNALDAKDFVRGRMNEINLITKELEQAKYSSTRRVFQQLPRHMRRRAASYNIKRLPTRLRLRAMEEIKGDPPKGKSSKKMKNCRRWRRRSANLSNEFKSKKGWLETHLWHAKRCKMIDYWGFRIAAHLNEKCLKSTFRSSNNGVILHDFSYWTPFWMVTCDADKLVTEFGNESEIVIEHEGVQICPIIIIPKTFETPLIYLHPAAIETGILMHEGFTNFLNKFNITLSSASSLMCTFKLQGSKSESVLSQFLNVPKIENYPLRVLINDPRITKEQCSKILTLEDFSKMFMDISKTSIPNDDDINKLKSELLISSQNDMEPKSQIPIAITKKRSEFFLSCPRIWARTIWYYLNKIKPIKVAGIDQINVISFENEMPIFPNDFVGSPAYEFWAESEKKRLETIYNRKPPSKRPSYAKLRIESPFKPMFSQFNDLHKAIVEIEGKGIITDFAEIYTSEKILIGYATTSSPASLKKGRSVAIASVVRVESPINEPFSVLVRNHCSPEVFRIGKLSFITKLNKK